MTAFNNFTKFTASFTRIAVTFLVRTGLLTQHQAKLEVEMIIDRLGLLCLVESIGQGKHENEAYIRMSRRGALFSLTRQNRVEIARTLNNAINHAGFEDSLEDEQHHSVKTAWIYRRDTKTKDKNKPVIKEDISNEEITGWTILASGKISFDSDINALYAKFSKDYKISRDDLYIKIEIRKQRKVLQCN